VSSSSPSYLTKNRFGVFILQVRVPVRIRQNRPDVKPLIQRSLRTRNRREALRSARKIVVWMEDNEFDIDKFDQEAQRNAELFSIGKPLFAELNGLWSEGDQIAVEEFLARLTSTQEEALRYISDLSNRNVDHFEQLLETGDREKITEFLLELPRIFKQPIREVLNRHRAVRKPTSSPAPSVPSQQPVRSTKDIKLDVAFEKWRETHQPPAMNQSSFGEYTRMIGMFLRIIKHINHNTTPRVSELTVDMISEYKTIFSEIPRSIRTEDKSIEKLLSMKGEKKSPNTIKNTFGNVGHFIQWLSGEGYPIQSNIHDVLTHYRKIKKGETKRRVPLDEQDLKALFLSDNYRLGKWKRESEYWAPLIALFTGMTRSEIIQLEVDDIYKQDNSYVIDVNERGSKILKASSSIDDENESSTGRKRIIPIHKQLIDIGLIEFVTHQKKRGEKKLFPCEERNNRSHFGAYGNRFSNYRKKVSSSNMTSRGFHKAYFVSGRR